MADKYDNKDLQNLPACVCEFIRQVAKKMRYRRNVRQDVQNELTAHFQDELKDCKTDEESRQKAQQLIAEFGDPKLLAVLLRRAKKRCRPLWRTIVARTFQAAGALIVCFAVYTIWFLTGKPTISVDYLAQLNQMSRPQLRDEDNAWPHYEKAISLYVQPHERISTLIGAGKDFKLSFRFSNLSEDTQSAVRKWIEQNESHWGSFTAEQKQLLQNCLEDGLVPYPRKRRPYGEYMTLDSALASVILRAEIAAAGGANELKRRLSGRVFEFDPNNQRDTEITKWFEQNMSPKDLATGIEVGALKYWIENSQLPGKTFFDSLLPFAQKLVAKWIQDNEPAWQEFAAGSSKSYCYRKYEKGGKDEGPVLVTIFMPGLSTFKYLARLGTWRARAAIGRGDSRQAIQDCLAVARTGSHWQGKGTLIEQLVGLVVGRLGQDEILDIAATHEISAADLKKLQQQLMQIYPQGYRLVDIESERLGFLDIVQHVFTDGGPGGGHLVPSRWPQLTSGAVFAEEKELGIFMPLSAAASMIHAHRDQTVAKFNELFGRFVEIAKTSPYQRHVRNLRSDNFVSALPKYRYFLIDIFIPAVDRVSEIGYWSKASHEATVTILALKRWRLEKNAYPPTLDELVAAGYLKELPLDPYSDKPFVYKRIGDDFTLYSLGPNFTDDSGTPGTDSRGRVGKWRDNGDTVFGPVPKTEAKS